MLWENKIHELLGVRHSSYSVMGFHKIICILYLVACYFLDRRKFIPDDLENYLVGWKREHCHHQPLDPFRDNKLVIRIFQMLNKPTEKFSLTVLVEP